MFLKESPRHFCFSRNILIITVLQFYMAPEMTGYLVFTLTACSFSICFFTLSPFFFFFPVTFSYQFLTMFFSLVYFIISKDPSIWFHPEKWTFKKKKRGSFSFNSKLFTTNSLHMLNKWKCKKSFSAVFSDVTWCAQVTFHIWSFLLLYLVMQL